MSSIDTSPRDVGAIIARYKAIGLIGGVFLGAVAGVMVAGPNLHEWTQLRAGLTFLGVTAVGTLIGYIAGELAAASLVSGGGHEIGGEAGGGRGSGSGGSSATGDSDGGGGDS